MRATAHATMLALLVMLPAAAAEGPGFRAVYGSPKSWDDAQTQCRAWGGALAKVDTAEAQGRMRKIKCADVLWVGAHEKPKTPGVNPELWTWISDGSSVSEGVWQAGEPNNFKDQEEECGFAGFQRLQGSAFVGEGGLGDAPCKPHLPFLCEVPSLTADELVWLLEDEEGDTKSIDDCSDLISRPDFQHCIWNQGCKGKEKNLKGDEWLYPILFLVLLLLAAGSTILVVIYGCCHDTRSGTCCPATCAGSCVAGAFCTRQEDPLPAAVRMRVTVPAGLLTPGEDGLRRVTVQTPGGMAVAVVVPEGLAAGAVFDTVVETGEAPPAPADAPANWAAAARQSKEERLDTKALTGLRGMAAFHVMVGHYFVFGELRQDLLGGQAMGLFYVLSGFVMYLGYASVPIADPTGGGAWLAKLCCCIGCCDACGAPNARQLDRGKPFSAKAFYMKRFARLAPTYYLTNAAALVLILIFAKEKAGDISSLPWRVPLTVLGVTSWAPLFQFPLNGVTWTISTLMAFYVLFPFLAPRLQRSVPPGQERVAAICMFLLSAFWSPVLGMMFGSVTRLEFLFYWFPRGFPLCRLPVFVMGMLAAKMLLGEKQASVVASCGSPTFKVLGVTTADALLAVYLALIPVFGSGMGGKALPLDPMFWRLLVEMFIPMLYFDWVVALVREESRTRTVLASRPMTFLGDISMCFYMWHMLVWEGLVRVNAAAWMIPVGIVVSLATGWLCYRFWEQPAKQFLLSRLLVQDVLVPSRSQDTELTQVVAHEHAGGVSPMSITVGDNVSLLAHGAGKAGGYLERVPPHTINKVDGANGRFVANGCEGNG